MGTISRWILAGFLLGAAVLPACAGPAQPAAPSAPDIPALTGIHPEAHPEFDRIVLEFSGPVPRVSSRFVGELSQDGSGKSERLPGSAFAEIRMEPAQAHDAEGHQRYPGPHQVRTHNLINVMAIGITGDFEGVLSLGVGMRTQTWVHTSTLNSPTRVAIDVGHGG